MNGADPVQIKKASRDLGDAALDPRLWPEVMEAIARASDATGAVLLQSDVHPRRAEPNFG